MSEEESIYQKLSQATARAIDTALGKTTLAELLDGYTKYIVLQDKIDNAIAYIKTQQKIFKDYDIVSDKQLKIILEILGDKE